MGVLSKVASNPIVMNRVLGDQATGADTKDREDDPNKIKEIFEWADKRGLDLGRVATWHDEPIQFTNNRDIAKKIKKYIYQKAKSPKAGIHFNNRLNKILKDTADADKEVIRPYFG